MAKVEIPFGEWLPSAPDFKNPGCVVADNVIPSTGGYNPFAALVGQSQTVTGAVQGATQLFDNSGNSIIVGGTDDRLFIRRSTITETTGLTSIGAGEAWDFAQFNDFVIATASGNSPQNLTDIDSDSTWSALAASAPVAKRCAKVGDFLMLGNVSGAPTRIQWSPFNSPAGDWTSSRLTQAGQADLDAELGEVQKIVGGRYATVFQKRGVQRLSYVGPPVVWRADIISKDRGAVAPFSVVSVGYLTFFLAQDGFYVTNGATIEPIGTQRVNKWFFDTVSQSEIAQTHGAIDWQNECIVWAFKTSGTGYNRLITYSWAQNRWATATVDVGWVIGSTIDGIDLDSLDALYTDLDSIPYSLDSAEFKSKDRRLAAFVTGTSTSEYSTFTGDPMEASWETGEAQPSPAQRVFVSEAQPLMNASTWDAKFTLKMRDNTGSQSTSLEIETGWGGFAPVRGEGQKVAVRMVKPAGSFWEDAQGVQVQVRGAGFR